MAETLDLFIRSEHADLMKKLSAFGYTYGDISEHTWQTQSEYMEKLESWGFKTTSHWARHAHSVSDIQVIHRAEIPFDIDGLVIKVLDKYDYYPIVKLGFMYRF